MELTLTPSQVEILQNCPRAFQETVLNGLREPFRASPASQLGNNLHAALHTFYRRGGHVRQELDDLLRLLDSKWDNAGFTSAEDEQAFREEGRRLLTDFYRATRSEPTCLQRYVEKTHGCGKALRLGTHRVWLRGRFDRLDLLADGSVEVLDYKTGNPPVTGLPDEEEMAERLDNLLYYRLAADLYPQARSITVSRYYLKSKRKVSVLYTPARLEAARAVLTELLDELERGIVPPLQNEGCSWCLVRRHGKCPHFMVGDEAPEAALSDF